MDYTSIDRREAILAALYLALDAESRREDGSSPAAPMASPQPDGTILLDGYFRLDRIAEAVEAALF